MHIPTHTHKHIGANTAVETLKGTALTIQEHSTKSEVTDIRTHTHTIPYK